MGWDRTKKRRTGRKSSVTYYNLAVGSKHKAKRKHRPIITMNSRNLL